MYLDLDLGSVYTLATLADSSLAKEGPAAWLEHSVHFPVIGAGQELALELPQTTAKIQVCIFFAG